MKHPYRIREIAAQAGLSQATVDRVLHGRGGVRESSVRAVHQAIAALDRRQEQSPLPARVFPIDLVVRDRVRVEAALRAELGGLRPAVVRPRFHAAGDPVAALARIARSQSQGVILQAAETPELVEAIGRLEIPVVTLGADLPASKRVAHVGLDEREAGATAAYLIEQWLADRAGVILVTAAGDKATTTAGEQATKTAGEQATTTAGDEATKTAGEQATTTAGEEARERVVGFRAELGSRAPNRRVLISGPAEVRDELAANPSVRAVYDPGSGDTDGVVAAFAEMRRNYDVFVAHDLDEASAELLRTESFPPCCITTCEPI
ncbi:LacI family DNA-binding transcriptional regulator [Paractinoplanes lichenicola]|uniref:LacI family DNA-binding transcriptional regulator n=1 Tax=Paractinoplanes lichenicola TaxID=2802976 RepID=UPI0027DC126F|nr:LacI family DNA-binding transcriptional regulator [Actinoplanes lichenicola]